MSTRSRDSSHTGRLPDNGKKTKGRVKIKMEYIDDKVKRYTTFSKRKTGLMKKAYELSTLTGTQVMMLVASETGHVYTFATNKLKPMITSEAGKALIQTCLDSPDYVTACREEPGEVLMTEADQSTPCGCDDLQGTRVPGGGDWPELAGETVVSGASSEEEKAKLVDLWPTPGGGQSDSSSSLSWSGEPSCSPASAPVAPPTSPPDDSTVPLRPLAPYDSGPAPQPGPVDYSALCHSEVSRGDPAFACGNVPDSLSGTSVIHRVDSAKAGEVPTASQPTDLSRSPVIVHL